ncbi:MAG: SH3 domain-containing protein [Phototrophicaceae bacterium]
MSSASGYVGRLFGTILAGLVLILSLTPVWVSAQNFTPIAVGGSATGTLNASVPSARYALAVTEAQSVAVRVFAITPGFAPALRVADPSGNVVASALNLAGTANAQVIGVDLTLGAYILEVSSANGQLGDFLINVEAEAVVPPVPLNVGQVVATAVSSNETRRVFSFSASPDTGRLLFVQGGLPDSGSVVTLQDAVTDEVLATSSARIRGARFLIPAGTGEYLVEVGFGGAAIPEPFVICLALESNPAGCVIPASSAVVAAPTEVIVPTLLPTQLAPLPPSTVCILASATGGSVNVRSGPSTSFNVITQLTGASISTVVGRLQDNSWYQINVNGLIGWISASVIRLGGPCQGVPVVAPPTTIPSSTLIPTLTPIATTPPPSTNPTAIPTVAPVATTTATLNFGLPANFGSTALTSGFVPDPFTVGITSGGSVNVGYLGAGCTGNATAAPDFSLTYASGAFPVLRFFFVGSGDTTMIINTPGGNYVCNDDSFGTANPSIDFNTPSSGRYDVWIGSFSAGSSVTGTLSITENTSNHP